MASPGFFYNNPNGGPTQHVNVNVTKSSNNSHNLQKPGHFNVRSSKTKLKNASVSSPSLFSPSYNNNNNNSSSSSNSPVSVFPRKLCDFVFRRQADNSVYRSESFRFIQKTDSFASSQAAAAAAARRSLKVLVNDNYTDPLDKTLAASNSPTTSTTTSSKGEVGKGESCGHKEEPSYHEIVEKYNAPYYYSDTIKEPTYCSPLEEREENGDDEEEDAENVEKVEQNTTASSKAQRNQSAAVSSSKSFSPNRCINNNSGDRNGRGVSKRCKSRETINDGGNLQRDDECSSHHNHHVENNSHRRHYTTSYYCNGSINRSNDSNFPQQQNHSNNNNNHYHGGHHHVDNIIIAFKSTSLHNGPNQLYSQQQLHHHNTNSNNCSFESGDGNGNWCKKCQESESSPLNSNSNSNSNSHSSKSKTKPPRRHQFISICQIQNSPVSTMTMMTHHPHRQDEQADEHEHEPNLERPEFPELSSSTCSSTSSTASSSSHGRPTSASSNSKVKAKTASPFIKSCPGICDHRSTSMGSMESLRSNLSTPISHSNSKSFDRHSIDSAYSSNISPVFSGCSNSNSNSRGNSNSCFSTHRIYLLTPDSETHSRSCGLSTNNIDELHIRSLDLDLDDPSRIQCQVLTVQTPHQEVGHSCHFSSSSLSLCDQVEASVDEDDDEEDPLASSSTSPASTVSSISNGNGNGYGHGNRRLLIGGKGCPKSCSTSALFVEDPANRDRDRDVDVDLDIDSGHFYSSLMSTAKTQSEFERRKALLQNFPVVYANIEPTAKSVICCSSTSLCSVHKGNESKGSKTHHKMYCFDPSDTHNAKQQQVNLNLNMNAKQQLKQQQRQQENHDEQVEECNYVKPRRCWSTFNLDHDHSNMDCQKQHQNQYDQVDPSVKLENAAWFHGPITRVEAETMLRDTKVASWLVRNREKSSDHNFSLSIKCASGFVHIRIEMNENGTYILADQEFATVPQLIHHFTRNRLPIKGSDHIKLMYPVITQFI